MKTIKIENAKTRFFESKEHYLKFRQTWKDFHNSDKLVWREDVEVYSWAFNKNITMKNVKHTSLSSAHYMLYNLLRGYEAHRGFTEHGEHGWAAYDDALSTILRWTRYIKNVNSPSESSRNYARQMVDALVLPFGDTLSQGVLVALAREIHPDFPEFEPEEWQDFTKVEKEAKSESLKDRLSRVFS
jgi:hypothetical protein